MTPRMVAACPYFDLVELSLGLWHAVRLGAVNRSRDHWRRLRHGDEISLRANTAAPRASLLENAAVILRR